MVEKEKSLAHLWWCQDWHLKNIPQPHTRQMINACKTWPEGMQTYRNIATRLLVLEQQGPSVRTLLCNQDSSPHFSCTTSQISDLENPSLTCSNIISISTPMLAQWMSCLLLQHKKRKENTEDRWQLKLPNRCGTNTNMKAWGTVKFGVLLQGQLCNSTAAVLLGSHMLVSKPWQ